MCVAARELSVNACVQADVKLEKGKQLLSVNHPQSGTLEVMLPRMERLCDACSCSCCPAFGAQGLKSSEHLVWTDGYTP